MNDVKTEATGSARPMFVRIGVGSAIFQGLLVVFGVILGFLITEWQADVQRKSEAQRALASIMEEIATNREAIASAQKYHDEKIGTISAAIRDGSRLDIRAFDRGFVAPGQVSDAAWTTASEIGALSNMPYEQVLSLSRLYGLQDAYILQQQAFSAVLYPTMFERGTDGVLDNAIGLRTIVSTFMYREQSLIEAYDAVLKKPQDN